ncbi:MAG: metal ABC transporter permease [Bacilli bacterium]|nr:metal ABC transporter permease [Bacilli bacterium]
MLQYDFMRIALIVAILLGVALPLVGSTIVHKRLSSSGDALAHSSLAGVAIGLVAGLNPLWTAVIACVVSFLIIELLRKRFSKYSEVGIVVVLSAAIGIAGILSRYASSSNFDSYLFGSIVLISNLELVLTVVLTSVIVAFTLLFGHQIFSGVYSENEAKVRKVPTRVLNFAHSLLLSLTVALGAKVVGSLVISSMLVLPMAVALQFKKGYWMTLLLSVAISVATMVGGLIASYYLDFPPGATIVSLAVAVLLLSFLIRGLMSIASKNKAEKAK